MSGAAGWAQVAPSGGHGWPEQAEQGLSTQPAPGAQAAAHAYPPICSCYEIYGGKVFDLLNGRKKLDVREDGRKRVQVRERCRG